jgi:hypothetical protein
MLTSICVLISALQNGKTHQECHKGVGGGRKKEKKTMTNIEQKRDVLQFKQQFQNLFFIVFLRCILLNINNTKK